MSGNFPQNNVQTISCFPSGDKVSSTNPSMSKTCESGNIVERAVDIQNEPFDTETLVNDCAASHTGNMKSFVESSDNDLPENVLDQAHSLPVDSLNNSTETLLLGKECREALDMCIDKLLSLNLGSTDAPLFNESRRDSSETNISPAISEQTTQKSYAKLTDDSSSHLALSHPGDYSHDSSHTVDYVSQNSFEREDTTNITPSKAINSCSPVVGNSFEDIPNTTDKSLYFSKGKDLMKRINNTDLCKKESITTSSHAYDRNFVLSSSKRNANTSPNDFCMENGLGPQSPRRTYSKECLLSLRYVGNAVNTPKLDNDGVWSTVTPDTEEDFRIFGPNKKVLDTKRLADLHNEKSGTPTFFARSNRGRYPRRSRNIRQSFNTDYERKKRRDYNENPAWYNDDVVDYDYQLPFGGLTDMRVIDPKIPTTSANSTNKTDEAHMCPKVKALFDTYREQSSKSGAESNCPLLEVPSVALGAKKLEDVESASKSDANVPNESPFDRLLRIIGLNANDPRTVLPSNSGGTNRNNVSPFTASSFDNVNFQKMGRLDPTPLMHRPFGHDRYRNKSDGVPTDEQFKEHVNSVICSAEQRYKASSLGQTSAIPTHNFHYNMYTDPFGTSNFRPISSSHLCCMRKKDQFESRVPVPPPNCGIDGPNASYNNASLPSPFRQFNPTRGDPVNFVSNSNAYHPSFCGIRSSNLNTNIMNVPPIGLGKPNARQPVAYARYKNSNDQILFTNNEEEKYVNYLKPYPNSSYGLPSQFQNVHPRYESDNVFEDQQGQLFDRDHECSPLRRNIGKKDFARF